MKGPLFLAAAIFMTGSAFAEATPTAEENKQTAAEYEAAVKSAPRRAPNAPIRVTVLSAFSEKERKKEKVQKVHEDFVKALERDSVLKVTDYKVKEEDADRSMEALKRSAEMAEVETDVYVYMHLDPEKAGVAPAAAYMGDIVSAYDSTVRKAENDGTAKAAQGMAATVKGVVKDEMGPTLPDIKSILAINNKYRKFRRYQVYGEKAGATGRFFKNSAGFYKKFKK